MDPDLRERLSGVSLNRRQFGNMLPEVDHLPHTLNISEAAFSKRPTHLGFTPQMSLKVSSNYTAPIRLPQSLSSQCPVPAA